MSSLFELFRANTDLSPERNVTWLVRLRWAAITGQTATILVASRIAGPVVQVQPLFAVVAFEVAFNLVIAVMVRRGISFGERAIIGHLLVDLVALTALFHFSGGPSNPFNFLYLVQIVLSAALLGAGRALLLTAVSAVLFAALFVPRFLEGDAHAGHAHQEMMRWHLEGMWVAFVIAATLIVMFLGRIQAELAHKREELEQERERAARYERLSSLVTLATGTAHELATPLSTIAVVSKELSRRFREGADPGLTEDLDLLRDEVQRCQRILQGMAAGAGEIRGSASRSVAVSSLLSDVIAASDADALEVRASSSFEHALVETGGDGLQRAIHAVLANALDAAPAGSTVRVELDGHPDHVRIRIIDDGAGIPQELRERVLEPFFTTKSPGRGMGLGLFVADNVLRQLGGALTIGSGPLGRGTTVELRIPRADFSSPAETS